MKTITIIEDLILEANRKDTLITKLGFNQENAELLEELTGPLSIIIGNKLIDVFAQRQLEYLSSAVPEEEERRMREEFKKNPEYRRKMGVDGSRVSTSQSYYFTPNLAASASTKCYCCGSGGNGESITSTTPGSLIPSDNALRILYPSGTALKNCGYAALRASASVTSYPLVMVFSLV